MEKINSEFYEFLEFLSESDKKKIDDFFGEFDVNFAVSKPDCRKFRLDFERAIVAICEKGASVEEALARLSLSNLGGFYARPSVTWFPLDDAAKIYPISMEHDRQHMFRLSVYLKEDVIPEVLQMALTFAIKRFPAFATTLKKGFFWHYLDSVKKRFAVEEESTAPLQAIKVSMSGSNSFRLLYFGNRISAEFFHVLTDGTGGMTFLKVIVTEYLRLLGVVAANRGDVWDIDETPTLDECENTFTKVEQAKSGSGFVDKHALQMNGRLSLRRPCRIIHFKMKSEQLKAAAKRYGGTITAYLLAEMFLACSAATDELSGDINIQVPVNMRKFYPSATVRNFSMYCGIRIPIDKVVDKQQIINEATDQLRVKADKPLMQEMITAAVRLVSSIRYIPLVIKTPIAKIIYGFLSEKSYTTTLSNLGVVKMPPELTEHIEKMDFCLGPMAVNRLACAAVTFGDITMFSISKMTADPAFEEKMLSLLESEGIEAEVEGSEYYEH